MIDNKPLILCVDDEPANLKLLEAVLIPRGYEVISAENGGEALEKIKRQRIDLVILDVMMPVIDGFEVCRRIKGDERHRNIPVVMVTALTEKEDRIRSIEAGAEDFISKPFDQGEVLARIKMLLKMKDLHERLSFAYSNINSLTSFGEDVIKVFDPMKFDLISSIDSVVSQIIRQGADDFEKPRIIIAGIHDKGIEWNWYQYESTFGRLQRNMLKLEAYHSLNISRHDAGIVFYNNTDIEKSELDILIKRLKSANITVKNIVAYLSNELCIIAINYGREVDVYNASILNNLVMQSLFLKSLSSQIKETDDAFAYTVHALARAAEANDEDTGNHIIRVGEYCAMIAKELGMSEEFISIIHLQAQMHDVGKIHMPTEILKKPGKLTPEEFGILKNHTISGAKIIGDHIRLTPAKTIAISHHERWDGSGYPYGLKGEQIPIEGRILNISDQYDALRNQRVYKPTLDHETTYKIITEGDGRTMPGHFDPRVLEVFKDFHKQFEDIYEVHKD